MALKAQMNLSHSAWVRSFWFLLIFMGVVSLGRARPVNRRELHWRRFGRFFSVVARYRRDVLRMALSNRRTTVEHDSAAR